MRNLDRKLAIIEFLVGVVLVTIGFLVYYGFTKEIPPTY